MASYVITTFPVGSERCAQDYAVLTGFDKESPVFKPLFDHAAGYAEPMVLEGEQFAGQTLEVVLHAEGQMAEGFTYRVEDAETGFAVQWLREDQAMCEDMEASFCL